jgi:hypothetical protein
MLTTMCEHLQDQAICRRCAAYSRPHPMPTDYREKYLRTDKELREITDAAETLETFLLKYHLTAAGSDASVALLGAIEGAREALDSE